MGQDAWPSACDEEDYPITQQWAAALRRWTPGAASLAWMSKRDNLHEVVVLFSDRIPAGAITGSGNAVMGSDSSPKTARVSRRPPRPSTRARALVAQRIYCYTTQVMVDASPLIYLAKLDALDVFGLAGHVPLITPEVERETARPGLAYRFPDALMIAEALRDGVLVRTELSEQERTVASQLGAEAGGLDAGESEVLAAAGARELPVLLHERRAIRMARSLGLETWSPVRLLIEGTPDRELSRTRVLEFARMVQMRFEDVEALVRRIEGTT